MSKKLFLKECPIFERKWIYIVEIPKNRKENSRMKKIIFVTCVIMLMALTFSTCFSFASESEESLTGGDGLKYSQANSATTNLAINGSKAVCTTTVITKNSSTVNKMVVTVYYYKSGGTYVGSNTVTVKSSGTCFYGATSKTLSSHGTYYAEALVKLYHNSQLLESFTLVTNNATY